MDDDASATQKQDQPVSRTQPPATTAQSQPTDQKPVPAPTAQKTQISVGNVESGESGSVMQEVPDVDADDDDEDEIKVAPQETKTRAVSQGGVADIQEENVEVQPSIPEAVTNNPEVEKFVEKSKESEKPELPQEVQDAGVTHSGPGVIDAPQNNFGVTNMPAKSYTQAIKEEKQTRLHDSRHWGAALIAYIWRKLNPKIGEKGKQG